MLVIMKTIAITVPEPVAKWARVWAARNNTNVSKLVGELLTTRMRAEAGYDAAAKRFLAQPPSVLSFEKKRYPTRDSLHAR